MNGPTCAREHDTTGELPDAGHFRRIVATSPSQVGIFRRNTPLHTDLRVGIRATMHHVEIAMSLVAIAVVVCAGSALATRIGWSPPLLLVLVGIIVSLVPFLPQYELSPELVLVGILPPLLYSAATTPRSSTSGPTGALISLSVGLVIFTTVIVGFVAAWLIPGLPLAAGFALRAIIAPPDAIAASAVRAPRGDAALNRSGPRRREPR